MVLCSNLDPLTYWDKLSSEIDQEFYEACGELMSLVTDCVPVTPMGVPITRRPSTEYNYYEFT